MKRTFDNLTVRSINGVGGAFISNGLSLGTICYCHFLEFPMKEKQASKGNRVELSRKKLMDNVELLSRTLKEIKFYWRWTFFMSQISNKRTNESTNKIMRTNNFESLASFETCEIIKRRKNILCHSALSRAIKA
jgi:hypothetical protein